MDFAPLVRAPDINLAKLRVFRTENFPDSPQIPWLDRPDWRNKLQSLNVAAKISAAQTQACVQWAEQGFVIVRNMFSAAALDQAWADYEAQLASGGLTPQEDTQIRGNARLPDRVLNAHFKVRAFEDILHNDAVLELVSLLLGAEAMPFQTIAGHKGSEQLAHSDSIHMTTYPQGYLAANWIAFEDIEAGSGPLVYYPGSHRLPYTYSKQCGISLDEGRAGYGGYINKYEPFIQGLIASHHLQPEYFMAKKGDVLFWHANLLHGGSPILAVESSRRALVCHYFSEGAVCYHDYTGTPSHVVRLPFLAAEDFDDAGYLRLNPDVALAGADPYQHYVRDGYRENRRDR